MLVDQQVRLALAKQAERDHDLVNVSQVSTNPTNRRGIQPSCEQSEAFFAEDKFSEKFGDGSHIFEVSESRFIAFIAMSIIRQELLDQLG